MGTTSTRPPASLSRTLSDVACSSQILLTKAQTNLPSPTSTCTFSTLPLTQRQNATQELLTSRDTTRSALKCGTRVERPCADISKLEQKESCRWDFNRRRHLQLGQDRGKNSICGEEQQKVPQWT